MSQTSTLDPQALLENLDGWVLNCLEDELSRDDAWQTLAKNISTAAGSKIYSVSDLSRLKQSSRPAADVIQGLVQRGLSLANLLHLLQQTNLTHLYSIFAPKEVACIKAQSHEGIVSVRPGGSINVSVSTSGNPPPQLVWYKGDTPLLHNTTGSLTLPIFGPQDEDIYLCLVRQQIPPDSDLWGPNPGQYLELWSNPIELCLAETAPSFSRQPEDVKLNCGDRLVLTCECDEAHPPPHFSWYREGELVLASDSPTLIVESVELSSGGQFWCVASNAAGQATSRRCTVSVSEVACSGPPVVVRQPQACPPGGVVSRGQPVQLWCSARSDGRATFVWTRNGRALEGASSPCHSTMSAQENNSDVYSSCLLYTPLDSDASEFRLLCIVSNSAGQVVSREAVLQVKEVDTTLRVYTAGHKWALLVGNCRYAGKPLLTTLPDCQRIAATLTQLGFRCLVLADLSLSHFRNAVSLLSAFIQPGDYVVFYYGGHGYHDSGDRMIAVDGCEGPECDDREEEAGLRGGCLSPVWVRNVLLRPQPAVLFIVLDMCRTTLPNAGRASTRGGSTVEVLPSAARCSVVLHGTSVQCAALEAPDSMSVLTKHLLRRLVTHASKPLTELAASVLQDVCGDSSRVREQQFPVLEADLALPRTLADCATASAGVNVERWKKMLSAGQAVTTEAWIPLTPTQRSAVSLSGRDEQPATRDNSSCNSSAQDDKDESFEEKFEAYMAEELKGLNIGFIRRNNCDEKYEKNLDRECESTNFHSRSEKNEHASEKRRQYTKHQLSSIVRPHVISVSLNEMKVSGTRARIRGQVSLLGGDHPVGNIAVVRVAVDFRGPPTLYTVSLEALGCRLSREASNQPLLTMFRVEDLHCLSVPLMATMTFSTSLWNGKTNCRVHESSSDAAKRRRSPNPELPTSSVLNLPVKCTEVSPEAHVLNLESSECKSKIVRLCLGMPGLAKTNMQVNDLRGSNLLQPFHTDEVAKTSFDFVNIAF